MEAPSKDGGASSFFASFTAKPICRRSRCFPSRRDR
jgi:hypothetical protein